MTSSFLSKASWRHHHQDAAVERTVVLGIAGPSNTQTAIPSRTITDASFINAIVANWNELMIQR